MAEVKLLGIFGPIVSILVGVAVTLLMMGVLLESDASDPVLIALSVAGLLVVLTWSRLGGKLLPKWLRGPIIVPVTALGTFTLLMADDRYPLLFPWLVGATTTAVFVVVGVALSWRSTCGPTTWSNESAVSSRPENPIAAAFVYLFAGILFLQPLIILINGQGDAAPGRVIAGVVTKAYQTHGKGAANYIVLDGPAGQVGSEWTRGEYSVDIDTYDTSPAGTRKCVTLHTGLLRLYWWSIRSC